MTSEQLFCGIVEVNLKGGETATFNLHVYYDKQDVDHYELYIHNVQDKPAP